MILAICSEPGRAQKRGGAASTELSRSQVLYRLLTDESLHLPQNIKRKDRREWQRLAVELQQNVILVPSCI
jgi:hypothetical protein